MSLSLAQETPNERICVRGDKIDGRRYFCREFMQREWDHMWTRVWHVGGRLAELERPGDYVVHNFRTESVLIVRQQDDGVRAFYNSCRHRGNRLVSGDYGGGNGFTCAYHGWQYGIDGTLRRVQDPDDFAGGSPCGGVRLAELPCDIWGGFIWYNMDPEAPGLGSFLDPIPTLLRNRHLDDMVRVVWRTIDLDANWKFAPDNFNESYHLPTVHPQLATLVDEDYRNTVFEMYPNGHNRMIEQGQPSMRAPHPNQVEAPWDEILRAWDLEPEAFAGRARDGRLALQRQRRILGPARGYAHYAQWADDELTDYFHHTLFPNVTLTGTPDGVHFFRTEPHRDDPEKCTFDYWLLVPRVEGMEEIMTVCGMRPLEEAELERLEYVKGASVENNILGSFVEQDLSVAVTQQQGFHSRGYSDALLSGQESRVRRFHEVLNDYLEGRR